jgi:hypothetical protein
MKFATHSAPSKFSFQVSGLPPSLPLARVQVSGLKPICPAHKLLPDFLKGFTLLKATSSKKPV